MFQFDTVQATAAVGVGSKMYARIFVPDLVPSLLQRSKLNDILQTHTLSGPVVQCKAST